MFAVALVCDHSHYRVRERIDQTHNHKQDSHIGRVQAVNVGVKVRNDQLHGDHDDIHGHVTGAKPDFFYNAKFHYTHTDILCT